MDNQHKKITGYRDLSQTEIDMMNKIKALGVQMGSLVADLRSIPTTPAGGVVLENDGWYGKTADQRWISIGATHLQEGLMALTRGIAQPTSF